MSQKAGRAQRRREARRQAKRERGQGGDRPGGRRGAFSGAQIAAVAAVAVLGVAVLIWAGNARFTTPTASATPTASTAPATAAAAAEHVRGVATAPVTIEEWADFQCPACGLFARQTMPQLLSSYVATGKVRIVARDFAFLGQESQWAAEAAECASEQGKYFEYHDKLYASQAGENRGAFSKANLKRFGAELGLDDGFAACVDSGRYTKAVEDETRTGKGKGIDRTPTLFVNGRKIEGAATFEQLRAIIEPLLAGG